MITTMFTGFTVSELGTVALCNIVSGESVAILLLGIVLCLPTKEWLLRITWLHDRWDMVANFACIAVLIYSVTVLAAGGFVPSIYAGF